MLELLWRWSFGAAAVLLCFTVLVFIPSGTRISEADALALRSRDALQITLALRHAVFSLPQGLLVVALATLVLITVLWTLLSAAGRHLILGRVAPEKRPFRFRSILVMQTWRAVLGWLAIVAIATVIQVVAGIANNKHDPDPYFFYLVGSCSSVLMLAFWAAINWYLSMGTIFCYAGTLARGAVRETVGWVHLRAADLGGISAIFFFFRLVLFAVAFVLLLLPSGLVAASPRNAFLWSAVVAIFYFVSADFFNISRLLSCMFIEEAIAEAIVEEPQRGPGTHHPQRRPPPL
jgi:hypothetical protein